MFFLGYIQEYYLQYELSTQSIKYCDDSWIEFSHLLPSFSVVGIGSGVGGFF